MNVEFTPPKGVVPEGTKSDDTFDLVCTFKVRNDGKVCLTMMGDAKMYDDKKEEPKTRQYRDEGMGMMNSFKESGYS